MKKGLLGIMAGMLAVGVAVNVSTPAETWAQTGGAANAVESAEAVAQPVVSQQDESERRRLAQLELAVKPESAEAAVQLFVRSHEIRNGGLLYAILTPEEQKRSYQRLNEQNWVLGVSSPWVKGYRITEAKEIDDSTVEYQLQLLEYTSTGFMGSENVKLTVKKQEPFWLIDSYTPVEFTPDMDLWSQTLNESTALGLVAEAQYRYWYVATGGNGAKGQILVQADGTEIPYRMLSEDIGTKEKLTNYLQEIFTSQAVSAYLNDQFAKKLLIDDGGQLAQPDADSGSLRFWSKAKVSKLNQTGQQATATLQVPVGEEEVETFTIQFAYEKNVGWRIATSPETIR